ncbi:hypothetical protein FSP39_012389 [Pinctada imbricata]|uniref:C2H2-type domain-containing protein n=1 Tax=Pinctada imbricata TaxID=66713 RepID=A0AA88XIL6_PINIB|nr:hypothetical protein FSP39_012389 [Pinctada imbricata]
MVTHSKSKDHLCDVCGFATAHKSQLKAHKLIHTGETYKCTVCPFEATKRQNLKYHMLTHTHEKPHQCEVCGQSFSLNKNMKRHMLLHSNEKPYKCDKCGFSAARGDKLKEHQLKAHGIGDFPKKKHRLSDYYNSLVPPDPTTTLEDLAAKFNITLPQKLSGSSVPVLVENPADGEDKRMEEEEVQVPETHVIIDTDQSFPVTITKVAESEGELTYQFCYAEQV